MKTFLKLIFIAFIVIIAGVIGITTYQFNTYKPRAVTEKANSNNLKYFQESYNDCRNSFLAEAKKTKRMYKNVSVSNYKIESEVDMDLTIDYCYIPAQKTSERLFLLTSGSLFTA
jgi:predicted membrane protein